MESKRTTVDELQKYVRTKRDLYEACVRNGYFLPRFKSNMIRERYLLKVMSQELWCPQYSEIRILPCPRKPTKQVIFDKLQEALDEENKDAGLDEDRLPDLDWLVALLSTLRPDDEVFSKDYVPPARKFKTSAYATIDIPKDFLEDLPLSKSKNKACRLQMYQEGKAQQRLERLREVKQQVHEQIELQKDRLDQMRRTQNLNVSISTASNNSSAQPQHKGTPAKNKGAKKQTLIASPSRSKQQQQPASAFSQTQASTPMQPPQAMLSQSKQ